jgi:SAM-dependent methyltransferase
MTVPRLFDPLLERQRRLLRPPQIPEALRTRLIGDIVDRLSLINRPFPTMLTCGPFAASIAPALTAEGRTIFIAGCDLQLDLEAFPMREASLDSIICAFGLETVNDLPGALIQMRHALKPDGLLLASLFAGNTLCELRAAWFAAEEAVRRGASLRIAPFPDIRELGGLLQRAGFALPVADLDRITVTYPDALSLMREIKALGLAAPLNDRSRIPVTRSLLARAAAQYERDFADDGPRIRATVEIAWLTGWAPHESQQQPLKPGSAKQRLADALRVEEHPLKRG